MALNALQERLFRQDASLGHLEGVRQALADGIAVNARDKDGFTALHYAMRTLPHQEDTNHLAMVQLLVESGADVHVATINGQTPLFEAAAEGLYEVVVYLHGHGADVNATLNTGANALFAIAEALEGRPSQFSVSVEQDGQSVVLTDPEAIREALGHHPDDETEAYLNVVTFLVEQGIDLGARLSETNQTPLFSAASRGCAGMVAVMLEGKVDLTARDAWRLTPMHYASRHGHARVVELLVEAGADVNARDSYGFTPLHEAAEKGHLDVVRCLVEHGADSSRGLIRSYGGYPIGATALAIAKKKRRRTVVRFLREGLANPDTDTDLLKKIIDALSEVGSQLDQADRRGGYSPWKTIAEQEALIHNLTSQLSEPFRTAHPTLVQRLATCAHLEHGWGSLQDAVRGVLPPL